MMVTVVIKNMNSKREYIFSTLLDITLIHKIAKIYF